MRAFGRVLRTPLGIAAVTLMTLVVLTAIFAPMIWGTEADVVDTDNLLAPPSAEHPIGTDHLGRDLLLRVLVATRLSLVLAIAATIVTVIIGMILGMTPMAIGFGEGGGQSAPLARAVIGGLITSTLLSLLVVPVVYTLLDDFKPSAMWAWITRRKPARLHGHVSVPASSPATNRASVR